MQILNCFIGWFRYSNWYSKRFYPTKIKSIINNRSTFRILFHLFFNSFKFGILLWPLEVKAMSDLTISRRASDPWPSEAWAFVKVLLKIDLICIQLIVKIFDKNYLIKLFLILNGRQKVLVFKVQIRGQERTRWNNSSSAWSGSERKGSLMIVQSDCCSKALRHWSMHG